MNLSLQDLIRPARVRDLREPHPGVVGKGAKQCWQFPGTARGRVVMVPRWRSCIIPSGARATSSEFCQKRKIPPPSSLDGRVGRRSPSEGLNPFADQTLDAIASNI